MRRVNYTPVPLTLLGSVTMADRVPSLNMEPVIVGNDIYLPTATGLTRIDALTRTVVGTIPRTGIAINVRGCLSYDAANNRIICFDEVGNRAIFDIASQTWGAVLASPTTNTPGNMMGVYDPLTLRVICNRYNAAFYPASYLVDGTSLVTTAVTTKSHHIIVSSAQARYAGQADAGNRCGVNFHSTVDMSRSAVVDGNAVDALAGTVAPRMRAPIDATGKSYFVDGDGSARIITSGWAATNSPGTCPSLRTRWGWALSSGNILWSGSYNASTDGTMTRYIVGSGQWDVVTVDPLAASTASNVYCGEVPGVCYFRVCDFNLRFYAGSI